MARKISCSWALSCSSLFLPVMTDQPNAAEKLLRLNPGHPLKTGEILDAFRRSGMHLNPKNASTILYTTLKRNPRFERVAGQAWGLTEWYPRKRKEQGVEPEQQELSDAKTA